VAPAYLGCRGLNVGVVLAHSPLMRSRQMRYTVMVVALVPSQFVRSCICLRGSGTLPPRVTMQAEIATLLDGRDRFDPEILTPKLEAYVDEQVAAVLHSICRGTTPMRAACT